MAENKKKKNSILDIAKGLPDSRNLEDLVKNAESLVGKERYDFPMIEIPAFMYEPLVEQPKSVIIEESRINSAKIAFEQLIQIIRNFETELDNEHEIGMRLVSFASSSTFHIIEVGYYSPDLVTFHGVDNKGQRVQLVQNVNQLSVLLMAVKKLEEKPRRLGFKLP